jgi:HEAT repeat protein
VRIAVMPSLFTEPNLRVHAAWALGEIDWKEVVALLKRALYDEASHREGTYRPSAGPDYPIIGEAACNV